MIKINFYETSKIDQKQLIFAIIVARYKGKWIIVRHRDRITWEIPGGHIEDGEEVNEAAKRELFEETGAIKFDIYPVCVYSVVDGQLETFGHLFFAEVKELEKLPESEIAEIKLVDNLPINLTYPEIQPYLFRKVCDFLLINKIK